MLLMFTVPQLIEVQGMHPVKKVLGDVITHFVGAYKYM